MLEWNIRVMSQSKNMEIEDSVIDKNIDCFIITESIINSEAEKFYNSQKTWHKNSIQIQINC